jgi:hypothetical protein
LVTSTPVTGKRIFKIIKIIKLIKFNIDRLLNLKNDALRKRFDSLKYDVKKIEEIVYDLSIRGLLQKPTAAATDDANSSMKED